MMGESITEITDINWSFDGTLVAAGCEKTLVLLDMKKILSQSVDALLSENTKQLEVDAVSQPTQQMKDKRHPNLNGASE
jgi:hypothetical protein